jgi:isochorismate pyruvate lyase
MSDTALFVPKYCTTMQDVRTEIDALDARIMALMAERSRYVAQAARIKNNPDMIVDVQRIEYIIDRVRSMACGLGAPPDVAEATYRAMIGAFIEFERAEWNRLRNEGHV